MSICWWRVARKQHPECQCNHWRSSCKYCHLISNNISDISRFKQIHNLTAMSMGEECLPKRLLFGELQEGKTSAGGQWKQYKDTLKIALNNFQMIQIPGRMQLPKVLDGTAMCIKSLHAVIRLFSHNRTHCSSVDFTINAWPLREMSWPSSKRMDKQTYHTLLK